LHPSAGHLAGPWEQVAVDLLGPYTQSDAGNKYIIVFTDRFTRFPEAKALPEATAGTVARAFVDLIVSRYGAPRHLLCDNGAQFTSTLLADTCRLLGVKRGFTTAYHPQANPVERVNQEITRMIGKFCTIEGHQRTWDVRLPEMLAAIRFSANATLGEVPAFLCTGRMPRTPLQWSFELDGSSAGLPPLKSLNTHVTQLHANLQEAMSVARTNATAQNARYKTAYDRGRKPVQFQPLDFVRILLPQRSSANRRVTGKFSPKYSSEVYRIAKRGTGDIFVLRLPRSRVTLSRAAPFLLKVSPFVARKHGWNPDGAPGADWAIEDTPGVVEDGSEPEDEIQIPDLSDDDDLGTVS
jgi:hypothetical protein